MVYGEKVAIKVESVQSIFSLLDVRIYKKIDFCYLFDTWYFDVRYTEHRYRTTIRNSTNF